jgi:hypothetical protein
MDNNLEKNNKLSKELNANEDVGLKTRIFCFFYYVLKKKDINLILCLVFLFLEMFQLISFAFSPPHVGLWKLNQNTMNYIQWVVTSTRLAPLMKYLSFNLYMVIYGCLLGYIFFHSLVIAMALRINKVNSKFYQTIVSFTRYFTSALTILFLIPFAELILTMINCQDNKVALVSDPIECWKGLHLLYSLLSVVFSLLFYFLIFALTIFYFDPFNTKKTATKIDTTADVFFNLFKILAVIRFITLSSEWISIVFMTIASLLNLKRAYENPTYNNNLLECIISIRNAAVFWTYLVLLFSKVLETTTFNGQIFLLAMGYPLIVVFSIIYYKKKSENFLITNSNFNDANEYLIKLKYLKILIESFLTKNKSSKSNKSSSLKKDEILLKGYITIHEETCTIEDCPLKKFLEDNGNFSLQKVSLLHYMNQMFNEGIKKFPNSKLIIMNYVQFNYEKKYNLNSAKTFLAKLEKSPNTMTEDFILYSIKQNINNSNSSKINRSYTGEEEVLRIEDTTEHKFKRLKLLIETATKLYGEFWGSLSSNSTNSLNLKKLFYVGNKLNLILTEINNLWESDLKSKKIDLECQSAVQLYAYFLREILKNKKKADEISKRLNEEQHYESRKSEADKFDIENLDLMLENQDLMVYSRATEKGECTLIQCSNSMVSLLGYSKQEVIGKRAEFLMPSIYVTDHAKMISSRIKNMRTSFNINKDAFKSAVEKKQIFILPKNKVGYVVPVSTRFSVYNDDDFSNAYIVKSKFELKDTKSVYAFYIVTKDDFVVDSISSSCLQLGLSMDLLKKYQLNLKYLVMNEMKEEIDFATNYSEYEEEPKKITWIFPDLIYPKNDTMEIARKSDWEKSKLFQESPFGQFNLLIHRIKYREDETLGYSFRLTFVDQKKHNNQDNIEYKFNFHKKKSLMYDMTKLNYMRTVIVKEKKTPDLNDFIKNKETETQSLIQQSSIKKDKRGRGTADKSDEEDDKAKAIDLNILSSQKVSEMHGKSSEDIKSFIYSLRFFGEGVTLLKREPETKSTYPDIINKQPLIKQSVDEYFKKMQLKRSLNTDKKERNDSVSTNASETSNEFVSDTTSSLNNIFNDKSVTNIRYFGFFSFLFLVAIISVEFFISLSKINGMDTRIFYSDKAFKLLNSLLYAKYFITEAILAQNNTYTNIDDSMAGNNTRYIINQMAEMSAYRQDISDTFAFFANATITFDQSYYELTNNQQVKIHTLSNGQPSTIINPFNIAISRIPTTIFYVSTVQDNFNQINMFNRNAYELMMNLLNDYLIVWRQLTFILVQDVKNQTQSDMRLTVIFSISFVISLISILGIRIFYNKFIDDREKPIDLFLTIKKGKFEELKVSSEAFLNKLLNKFFGNEEAEEDMVADNTISVKDDDLMIGKLNQKNEYKQSIRTSSEYILILVKIIVFFFIFQAYMIFKYIYIDTAMKNVQHFTDVFNVTQYSQSDLVLSLNIAK